LLGVGGGLRWSPYVPADRGSCFGHSHVRGAELQCGYPQEVAPKLERTDCSVAKKRRGSGLDGGWLARPLDPGYAWHGWGIPGSGSVISRGHLGMDQPG